MENYMWIVMASVISCVTCQWRFRIPSKPEPPVPDNCRMYDAMYKQCCIIPPFFTRDIARKCGAKLTVSEKLETVDIITVRRQMFNKCNYWICVLNEYDLLETNPNGPSELVDHDKYYLHLDRWVDLNPSFADVMVKAKNRCKNHYRLLIPLKKCEYYTFQQCLRHFLSLNCPKQAVVGTKECEDLMKFYGECKEYYLVAGGDE